ncbi:MAG: sigma-E processing peptidase SpoIIGA [Erysipelotrichaceae bacterium]|nr:sigma-E processing peptidase SpoIIGA [Erysipelotrichaceae bacterium]MBQ7889914.1 sigma-E processing peptidase SpoIIGA [Erysipelotrichaceae bacterium]
MKSYLEVLWLLNTVILYVSWHLTAVLTQKKKSYSQLIMCASVQSLIGVLGHGFVYLASFFLFSFMISGWKFLFWIESFLFYFLLIHCCTSFSDALISEWIVYVDANSMIWLWISVVLLSFDYFSAHVLKKVIVNSELMIPVEIEIQEKKIQCIGYYDSGNCCVHEGKPVILIRYPFSSIEVLRINGVGENKLYPAIDARILLQQNWIEVTAVYVKNLQVECLLHRTMK